MTLGSIKKLLGHEGRTLDVLKLDIEGYEWAALAASLEDGTLKQVHTLPYSLPPFLSYYIFIFPPSVHPSFFPPFQPKSLLL